jgi:hypothetical protein
VVDWIGGGEFQGDESAFAANVASALVSAVSIQKIQEAIHE